MTDVTFTLSGNHVGNATGGILLGDFNQWNQSNGVVLQRQDNGALQATLSLEAGKYYEYRYLLSDGRWVNDEHANPYTNAHGQFIDNCSLIVPADEITPPVATPSHAADVKVDDLTKLEGIGKKIAELLNAHHICTFEALAQTPMSTLQALLHAAGSRFKSYDPAIWVEQATLARDGQWDALKALQRARKNAKKA